MLLQVRVSRLTVGPRRAAAARLLAGALLAVACLLYGVAAHRSAAVAVIALCCGGVVHTVGELLSASASWALSYELADPEAPGAYQGIFATGVSAGTLIAPLIITATAIRYGVPGWLALGALFLGAGAGMVPATRWAIIRRRAIAVHVAAGQAPVALR